MYFHIPLLLLLLANTPTSDANILTRSSESVIRAVSKAHRHAIKRSTGLARDIRLAVGGFKVDKRSFPSVGHVYCVSSPGFASNNTGLPNGSNGININGTSSSLSPSGSFTSSGSASSTRTSSGASSSSTSSPQSSPWKLKQSYQGSTFFDGWDFFVGADPTQGQVTYVDQNTAQSANLVEINSAGNAIMRVETTPQVQVTRQSVRITTTDTYTGGLVIMDSVHMPTGCGTWPAFWSNGPNWPAGGEIDIVEGVNDYTLNQATIHTNVGCTLANTPAGSNQFAFQGNLVSGTNCAASQTSNEGCGVRGTQVNSFGSDFNDNGGGVYAMKWDTTGISVYFFPRNSIPSDITSNAPQPSSWGTPMANWPASGCSPFEFFYTHSAIFDTTLCGDWASAVWSAAGVTGQEQSCAQRTGVATCEEFIRNNGADFAQAYWEVKSVKIYQTS
ncbi:concanavalin A-like lectin/glucanase domain-containing protein [Abortiporus biennis]|nr:concanavalin A-like lectin/glucanase domain-containing protein [Abortiporus biennis]